MVLLLWSNFKNSQTSQLKALWVVNPSTEPTISFHPFPSISIEVNCWNTPFLRRKLEGSRNIQSHPRPLVFFTAFSIWAKIGCSQDWNNNKLKGKSNPWNHASRQELESVPPERDAPERPKDLAAEFWWLVGEKRQRIELRGKSPNPLAKEIDWQVVGC